MNNRNRWNRAANRAKRPDSSVYAASSLQFRRAGRRSIIMIDKAEVEDERDEYDELLATLGRTFDQDVRIAIHEAGHAVAARLLGHPLGGATVNPGTGYEGRV